MKFLLHLSVAVALLSLTACQKKEAPPAKTESVKAETPTTQSLAAKTDAQKTETGKAELSAAQPAAPKTESLVAKVAAATIDAPKPMTAEIVKETERSRHFAEVNRQLELGGTLYGYVDVDGDVLQLAGGVRSLMEQLAQTQPNLAPFVKQDFAALFTSLGLTDVKAVGVSSVPDDAGFYRNRAFFYTPAGRRGLLAGLGGKPAAFSHVRLAPADTDLFAEAELDVPAVYAAIREIAEKIGGDTTRNALEDALQKASNATSISFPNLISGLKGRTSVVVRLEQERTVQLGGGLVLPAFSVLLCVDGVGQAIEPALAKSPALVASQSGALHLYEFRQAPPVEGVKPVIAVEGGTLYFATTAAFLNECRNRQTGLAQDATFRERLSHVGDEGNGLVYVTPRLFARLRQIETLNAGAPEQLKSSMRFALARLPSPNRPLVSVRTNLPEGILVRSYWDRSLKQDVAMISVYNPVTIGLLAAMAIPAFEKVRTASQEKAVLNNLRQLAAAADQYYLEQGVSTVTYDQIVGPDKYIKVINSVAGENYRALRFVQGQPLRVQLRTGKMVEYK